MLRRDGQLYHARPLGCPFDSQLYFSRRLFTEWSDSLNIV